MHFLIFKIKINMPYKSNTKQQMDTFKKSMDIKKKKLKKLEEEKENLSKSIELEERKFKLYEFMDKYNFTEEEVIKIFGLEQVEDNENLIEEFGDVREIIPGDDMDTSEDEYTELSDIEGPIDSGVCDEIVDVEFSNDGKEANKQLVKRLLEEQDLYFKSQCSDNKKYHYITKDNKELTIINFSEGRYQYGLLITNNYTPSSDIFNSWDRFGNKKSKHKKYDFKGKNIEEVVQMIHNILS